MEIKQQVKSTHTLVRQKLNKMPSEKHFPSSTETDRSPDVCRYLELGFSHPGIYVNNLESNHCYLHP